MTPFAPPPLRPSAPLRLLVVTNMYPTAGRPLLGAFVAEQVESLRARGIATDVLFVDGPGSTWNYAAGPRDLHRALHGTAYDLIHAHYVFSGLIAATQRRLPIVLTHHGIEAQQGWTAPLCRLASRLADATIATSPAVARGLRTPGATILPCGVDTDLFRPLPQAEARARLGLPAGGRLILFLGAPRPEKRLPLIEAAVERLRADMPEAALLKVHDQLRAAVPFWLNAADVLVLASVAEGSPVAVREAMACNLPVVSTDVGDVRALFDGLPGHFVAAGEAEDLAANLKAALAFAGRTAGRTRILPWSLAAVAEKLEAIYREVLGAK